MYRQTHRPDHNNNDEGHSQDEVPNITPNIIEGTVTGANKSTMHHHSHMTITWQSPDYTVGVGTLKIVVTQILITSDIHTLQLELTGQTGLRIKVN